ncbi:MAG: methyltransferase domain-containing protein [Candidatus Aminicenantes bacterium]|nr:methyltransferase domain-containing protein [Candidatus Aminicenantes bacterium]
MAEHVCPLWVGYLLISPLRKLLQNPQKILAEYVKEGMTVLEVGPALGFFSLPMARMVGKKGKVVCVDLQEKMLRKLLKRAAKKGLAGPIETRACAADSLGIDDLSGQVDFVLAFAVVHEVPAKQKLLSQVARALKPGGKLLIAEPKNHVPVELFDEIKAIALAQGLEEIGSPQIGSSLTTLFIKRAE